MNITCCYQCTDRKMGCHSECDRYKAEKEALHKAKDTLKQDQLYARSSGDRNLANPRAFKHHLPVSSATRQSEGWK